MGKQCRLRRDCGCSASLSGVVRSEFVGTKANDENGERWRRLFMEIFDSYFKWKPWFLG